MHIYSDSKCSDLLQSMTTQMGAGFLNDWNSSKDHRKKIEMVRSTDNKYRLGHVVTATQKTILKAFRMDANIIKYHAEEISRILKGAK